MKTGPGTATDVRVSSAAYVRPLRSAISVTDCGAKAANQSQMLALGLPIPDGFVLTDYAFLEFLDANGLGESVAALRALLDSGNREAVRSAGRSVAGQVRAGTMPEGIGRALYDHVSELNAGSRLIVRSSAVGEDGRQASFAGQLDSFPDVACEERLIESIQACWASYWSERCLFYQMTRKVRLHGMGVLIQELVPARFSGVLFTCHPDIAESLLVEYCRGPGDALVSGRVSPGRVVISRDNLRCLTLAFPEQAENGDDSSVPTDAQLAELARYGLTLERLSGCPQDVEWTIDTGGRLYLVQARPITVRIAPAGGPQHAPHAGKPPTVLWSNANISENFPAPVSPLLYSIASAGYYHNFRNLGLALGVAPDRVREMEYPLRHLIGVHGGRLYYNLTNIHAVLRRAPFGQLLANLFNGFVGATEQPKPSGGCETRRRCRLLKALEACRLAFRAGRHFLFLSSRVAAFERLVEDFARQTAPAALEAKPLHELLDDFRGFLDIRCHRWLSASLADAAAMLSYGALKRLLARAFLAEERSALCPTLLKGLIGLASSEPITELWELAQMVRRDTALADLLAGADAEDFLAQVRSRQEFAVFRARWDAFLERWGFRRSGELMLTVPSFEENPAELVGILRAHVNADCLSPAELLQRQDAERHTETERVAKTLGRRGLRRLLPWPSKSLLFRLLLNATHRSIALRERARLKQALLYGRCRRIALAIGARLVPLGYLKTPGEVFNLNYQEIDLLLAGSEMHAHQVKDLVALRQAGQVRLHALNPPDSFELAAGAYLKMDAPAESAADPDTTQETILNGVGACGGRVTAPAAILQDVAEYERLRPGAILVTRQTDPGWGPIFPLVKGLVIERGGMLSHGAILAREYGIPAVVGVRDAMRRIAQGQTLIVNGDHGIVELVT